MHTYWISSWVPYSCYASKFFEKNHPSALIQRNKSSAALFGPESYGKCLGPGPQPNPKHLFLQLRIGEVFTVWTSKAFTKLAMLFRNNMGPKMSCMKPSFSTKWLTQIVRLDCPIQIQTLTTHGVFWLITETHRCVAATLRDRISCGRISLAIQLEGCRKELCSEIATWYTNLQVTFWLHIPNYLVVEPPTHLKNMQKSVKLDHFPHFFGVKKKKMLGTTT